MFCASGHHPGGEELFMQFWLNQPGLTWEVTPSSNRTTAQRAGPRVGQSSVAQLLPAERQRTTKDQSRSKQVPRSKRRTDPFPHISPCSNSRPEHYIYATWDDVIKYIHLNLDTARKLILKMSNVSLKDHHLVDVKLKTKCKQKVAGDRQVMWTTCEASHNLEFWNDSVSI